MLRKHVKIEPMRWYHHCDRLGMLVWQDMVNGGGLYEPFAIRFSRSCWATRPSPDSDYAYFAREEVARDREAYTRELEGDRSIIWNITSADLAVWVPFNEGWGQFDANRARGQGNPRTG